MSKGAREAAARRRVQQEKEMAEKTPTIHAEIVVFFKPDQAPPNLIPEGHRKGHPVVKSFRQATLQIQAMASESVVTIDEGVEGSRHFLHWDDVAHIEVVDARIRALDS